MMVPLLKQFLRLRGSPRLLIWSPNFRMTLYTIFMEQFASIEIEGSN
jgi:hypothetical protein